MEILKQLGDLQLFTLFCNSGRLRLKTKGLTGQFLKMDVAKFQGLMKIKLNVHADWGRWLTKLLEMSQDYALVLPLWHFAYERLYSDERDSDGLISACGTGQRQHDHRQVRP